MALMPAGTGPRLRLLVVDDEPAVALMAARGLRQVGHQVTVLHTAEAAIARLRHEAFEVLVTDLGLGDGMDGWELVRRAHELCQQLRVVMVSGWALDIAPSLAAANGVDVVLSKPYRLAALIQAIQGPTESDAAVQAS